MIEIHIKQDDDGKFGFKILPEKFRLTDVLGCLDLLRLIIIKNETIHELTAPPRIQPPPPGIDVSKLRLER